MSGVEDQEQKKERVKDERRKLVLGVRDRKKVGFSTGSSGLELRHRRGEELNDSVLAASWGSLF